MKYPFLLTVATVACTTTTAPVRTEPAAGSFHTMAPGETVWDIARQSGLSVEEIVEVNGLPSANEVAAGQVLFLPAGGAPVVDVPAPAERTEADEAPRGAAALVWPVEGVVLRDFGKSFDGLLIAAPAGAPVVAAADGEVAFAGDQGTSYGLLVVLKHAGDLTSVYGHLGALDVKPGARVKAGERIGVVGTTGHQESPRLHFQVRRGRTAVDPLPLLPE